LLWIPPHRSIGAVGIDHDGCVGSARDGTAVGVVQEVTGHQIARMPAVVHQRGGAGSEAVHVLMQRIELIDDGLPRKLEHLALEPVSRATESTLLTCLDVDRPVR
jgi:hypothetical protein